MTNDRIESMSTHLYRTLFLICCLSSIGFSQHDIHPGPVVPTQKQISYQAMEFVGFIHFNMNTFTGKEWGYGDEDPKLFNPEGLDVEQWVRAAKSAGMIAVAILRGYYRKSDFQNADLVIDSFSQLTYETLEKMVKKN